MSGPAAGFEVLEHTADVGISAWGPTLDDVFVQATVGLAEIAGVWRPDGGDRIEIGLEAGDVGGLLVDWLSEVLYLHDSRRALVTAVSARVTGTRVSGSVGLAPLGEEPPEGTQVKAVTYHRLEVAPDKAGWRARVYLDV